MTTEQMMKKFPSFFSSNNVTLPSKFDTEEYTVYRACITGQVEKDSFLCTYVEQGFSINPSSTYFAGEFSLSVYANPKHFKRFLSVDRRAQHPWTIAKGCTDMNMGPHKVSSPDFFPKRKSHIDWWLYDGAQPWLNFELCNEDELFPKKEGVNNFEK